MSLNPVGTTIAACGAGLIDNPPSQVIWNGSPNFNCTAGGLTVPAFPSGVFLPKFTIPHGPFQNLTASAYACLICGGGEYGGESLGNPEGYSWNVNGAGEQISNITLDLGGGNGQGTRPAVFGYYTLSSQERTIFSNMKWTDYAPAGGAGFFPDRTEAPTGTGMPMTPNPAGATRPVLRDLSLVGASASPCPLVCYGIVQEGANTEITFTGCSPSPIAWVTSVNGSGQVTGIAVGYGGNCPTPTSVTCTVTGAPQTYPWGPGLDASGNCAASALGTRLAFSGTRLVSISTTPPISSTTTGVVFPQGLNSGGMILENVNMFANPGMIQDGLWMEGVVNPLIGHLHCQGMNISMANPGYCEHIGAGHAVFGGEFLTHDVLNVAAGLIDLGPGIDNNQMLISLSATTGGQNIILDEKNGGLTLTSSAYNGEIVQYTPGSMLIASAVQGTTLYGHLNTTSTPSMPGDNAGVCPLNSSLQCTVTFSKLWNSPPACPAFDQTTATPVKIMLPALTTAITFVAPGGSSGDVVAYICEGNPN